jgi:hypothetical protein
VSRRGPEVLDLTGLHPTERKETAMSSLIPPEFKAERGEEGLTVYLKVNYKVILLAVVTFDLIHTSINEIVSHFFGL